MRNIHYTYSAIFLNDGVVNVESQNRHQSQGGRSKGRPETPSLTRCRDYCCGHYSANLHQSILFLQRTRWENRKLAQGVRLDATTDTVLICGYASRLPYSNVFAPFYSKDSVCNDDPSDSRLCVCVYKKILICGGINVFWAQVISLDFVFQHSSLSQEIHSPWNISGQTRWDAQWLTAFHCAAAELQPRLTPPFGPVAALWGFELFGPWGGSILCFKNSIFMVANLRG